MMPYKLESAGCNQLPALSWGLRDKSEPRPGRDLLARQGFRGKAICTFVFRVDRPFQQQEPTTSSIASAPAFADESSLRHSETFGTGTHSRVSSGKMHNSRFGLNNFLSKIKQIVVRST
jgi:hypothetical protein